jgi:N-acetylmuramoyl-L-alanine amidase
MRIERRDNARYRGGPLLRPNLIVWHCSAGTSLEGALSWLNRRSAGIHKASYHYLIDQEGLVVRMLPPDIVAYHAGRSAWPVGPAGVMPGQSVNGRSIGICFINDNSGLTRLTQEQLEAGLELNDELVARFGHHFQHAGHREVAPGRKTDPHPALLDLAKWRLGLQ